MSLKSKLSGLKRTNFNNKSDNQKRKIIEKHYNNIGKELPKYMQGKVNNKTLNRALNTLEKEYNRQIKNEKAAPGLYKEFKKFEEKAYKEIKKELKDYNKDIQKAYTDKNRSLSFGRDKIAKQDFEEMTMKKIKEGMKATGLTMEEYLNARKNSILTRDKYKEHTKQLINDLVDTYGKGGLNQFDKQEIEKLLDNVGYLEYSALISKLEYWIEESILANYKGKNTNHEFNTKQSFILSLKSTIHKYNPNNSIEGAMRRNRIKIL